MNEENLQGNELAARVLAFVAQPNYQPVKPRVLAKKLGLAKEEHDELKKTIKRLVKQGRLVYGSKHFVQSVAAAADAKKQKHTITGIYRRTSGGFGFVSPRPLVKSADRSKDIYIPVDKSRDAADGDLVAVRLKKGDGAEGGRLRGEVVEVLERETHRFVGTYSEDDGTGWVRVDGTALRAAHRRRRSRRQERGAGRQSRDRDGPLPVAHSRRGSRDRRSAGRKRSAGRRYAVDHARIRPAGRVSRRRARSRARCGRAVRRTRSPRDGAT